MNVNTSTIAGKPRKRRRWWLYCVIGSCVLVFGAMAALGLRTWWMDRQIHAELERIRAAGEPLSAEDLDAMHELPSGEADVTELWVQALEPLDEKEFKQQVRGLPVVDRSVDEPPLPGESWDQREEAEALLAHYGESLELIHKATEVGGAVRYPMEFDPVFLAGLDRGDRIRRAGELLRLEAYVRAHRDDVSGAAKSLEALFALGRSIEQEPLMPSFLTRLACDRGAVEGIRRLLPVTDFAGSELRGFQQALRAMDYRSNVRRAILGERVAGLEIFNDRSMTSEVLQGEYADELDVRRGAGSVWWSLFWRDDCLAYLRFFGQLAAAARLPWPDAVERNHRLMVDRLPNADMRHMLHIVLSGPSQGLVSMAALNTGWMRAADAAIGVELYRRGRGELPETLEQLVPEFLPQVPADPFDGQPLRYVVGDEEYLIYSVGYDFTDDGGDGDDRSGPDVVFRVRRQGTDGPDASP